MYCSHKGWPPPFFFFLLAFLWFLSALLNWTLTTSSHCSSTMSLQAGTEVSIKNTEIINLSLSFFLLQWCVCTRTQLSLRFQRSPVWYQRIQCALRGSRLRQTALCPHRLHHWSTPGGHHMCGGALHYQVSRTHKHTCTWKMPPSIYTQIFVWVRRSGCFCRYFVFKVETQLRRHNSSASGWPKQFMTFNKRFYKCFVGDKTAPLSTVAEEEEGQNESISTCKERWGAGVQEEMRIYYSTDYSYSAINASCYSAIPIQG